MNEAAWFLIDVPAFLIILSLILMGAGELLYYGEMRGERDQAEREQEKLNRRMVGETRMFQGDCP